MRLLYQRLHSYSTVSAVLSIKAVPVIVDVLPDTFCIDPAQVKRALSDKTKAIIVCTYGWTYGGYGYSSMILP